jgi:hypothetical protein
LKLYKPETIKEVDPGGKAELEPSDWAELTASDSVFNTSTLLRKVVLVL